MAPAVEVTTVQLGRWLVHRGKQTKALRGKLLSDQGDGEGCGWGCRGMGHPGSWLGEGEGEDRLCHSWCQGWGQSEFLKCKDHHKVILFSLGV